MLTTSAASAPATVATIAEAGGRPADGVAHAPGRAGHRQADDADPHDRRPDLAPPEATDPATERRHGQERGDRVRARERPGQPWNAEGGVEREREADVHRVLEAVEDEGRARVVQRVVPAQDVEVRGERGQTDAEADERVGHERGVVGRERAALEQRHDDRSREADVQAGGRDHDHEDEPQPPREPVPERRPVAARDRGRELGLHRRHDRHREEPVGELEERVRREIGERAAAFAVGEDEHDPRARSGSRSRSRPSTRTAAASCGPRRGAAWERSAGVPALASDAGQRARAIAAMPAVVPSPMSSIRPVSFRTRVHGDRTRRELREDEEQRDRPRRCSGSARTRRPRTADAPGASRSRARPVRRRTSAA